MKNAIVGVCRFSYLGRGGFANSNMSLEERVELLFDADRLTERFAMFETLCLPSLAAQTDRDFKLVVLSSDALPNDAKERLRELANRHAFLTLAFLPPMGPLLSTRRAYRKGWEDGTPFVTGFRIDDDDAVAVDYIARTRVLADRAIADGWADADHPLVVAFHRGVYVDMLAPSAPFYDFRETAPLGLASAMITRADDQVNIFRWNHRRLAAHVRTITDPTDQMFLRTLHTTNDSDRKVPPGAEPIETATFCAELRARFGVDPDRLQALMQGPRP
ncbi:hypothetical protein ACMU_04680 [Actibacterium mucosum KCTC 23349]|uniref:Rhamnosyl transferase n=1 Tax=Actibacterium mucosum KCTC 23349 TaxID=1454373 RepID=A0A037ZCY6_9RHOB|nr:glycosyltransferase [Actibacterium mucosum]KAJ54002.1 hypothetical protein ACMU_04680 [Actibacterium mucosum KCTC 23349]